ncbi:uncharacterized protein FIBRA_06249 [Fibroporia radiculosa]|uniref:Uncharacterized protein n=1 Tax=Fibroporia radiculosa TaxID=599839 RepID=J4GSE7_9APHY|nr:uncharacterized protein FIBRA_06249 [Fibroporia radiculosa]CCM04090.1 predicted protein [Fibroporia radiculosa]
MQMDVDPCLIPTATGRLPSHARLDDTPYSESSCTRKGQRIPTELIEKIIDLCQDDRPTLIAFALASTVCTPRARYHLFRVIHFYRRRDIDRFLELSPEVEKLVEELAIHHCLARRRKLSLSISRTVFSRCFTRLRQLAILGDHIRTLSVTVDPPESGFTASQFMALTHLNLAHLKFRSFAELRDLIYLLPNLSELCCIQVTWRENIQTSDAHQDGHQLQRLQKLKLRLSLTELMCMMTWLAPGRSTISLTSLSLGEISPFANGQRIGSLIRSCSSNLQHLQIGIMIPDVDGTRVLMDRLDDYFLEDVDLWTRLARSYIGDIAKALCPSECRSLQTLDITFRANDAGIFQFGVSRNCTNFRSFVLLMCVLLCQLSAPHIQQIVVNAEGFQSHCCSRGCNFDLDEVEIALHHVDSHLSQAQFSDLRALAFIWWPNGFGALIEMLPLLKRKQIVYIEHQPELTYDSPMGTDNAWRSEEHIPDQQEVIHDDAGTAPPETEFEQFVREEIEGEAMFWNNLTAKDVPSR